MSYPININILSSIDGKNRLLRSVEGEVFKKSMPSPTIEEQNSDSFNAIWDIIKTWDIKSPEYYNGYCGADGSHVKLILDELNKRNCLNNRKEKFKRLLDE